MKAIRPSPVTNTRSPVKDGHDGNFLGVPVIIDLDSFGDFTHDIFLYLKQFAISSGVKLKWSLSASIRALAISSNSCGRYA